MKMICFLILSMISSASYSSETVKHIEESLIELQKNVVTMWFVHRAQPSVSKEYWTQTVQPRCNSIAMGMKKDLHVLQLETLLPEGAETVSQVRLKETMERLISRLQDMTLVLNFMAKEIKDNPTS